MVRKVISLVFCLSIYSAAFAQDQPREPKGIYVAFRLDSVVSAAYSAAYTGQTKASQYPYPALTLPPTNDVLIKYFTRLLDNPSVSGLSPEIPWNLLSLRNPGPDPLNPAARSYLFEPIDDLFIAVNQWNTNHPRKTPKTIQLIISPGFNSPSWVFDHIDAEVFAAGCESGGICTGDCDGLFLLAQPPAPPHFNYSNCGYTTIFWEVEGVPQVQEPFPLPWNPTYKNDWRRFLITLNAQLQSEPSNNALVSIEMAGPTASSTEMILPNAKDQGPLLEATGGFLTLSPTYWGSDPTRPNLTVADAWDILLANSYGSGSNYYNTDKAFIEEWDRAIDIYSGIFSGITLSLTTTSNSLPTFTQASDTSEVFTPAPGFESDCDEAPGSSKAMACAAVTQVLDYFVNPHVGGSNAKATQENGLTARNIGKDLGPNGIKWLAVTTKAGTASLPGTGDSVSPVIGGLQMAKPFSSTKSEGNGLTGGQLEGCPNYPKPDCHTLTPSEGFNYVLKDSFFPGTPAAPAYGDSVTVDENYFSYSNAHMNFLQIYSDDILYADGLGECTMFELTGSPDFGLPPGTAGCMKKSSKQFPGDAPVAESELEAASANLLNMAEQVP